MSFLRSNSIFTNTLKCVYYLYVEVHARALSFTLPSVCDVRIFNQIRAAPDSTTTEKRRGKPKQRRRRQKRPNAAKNGRPPWLKKKLRTKRLALLPWPRRKQQPQLRQLRAPKRLRQAPIRTTKTCLPRLLNARRLTSGAKIRCVYSFLVEMLLLLLLLLWLNVRMFACILRHILSLPPTRTKRRRPQKRPRRPKKRHAKPKRQPPSAKP